ncbi:MAG: BACON domain-containing protein [Bacteroidales bacterium]
MKIKNLLMSILATALVVTGCKDEENDFGEPSLTVSESEMEVDKASATKTVTVLATRDWTAASDVEWIAVDPASGKASDKAATVTVTLLENTGAERTGKVTFTSTTITKTLTIKQAGSGSAEGTSIYYNDFDKVAAEKTFGTSGTSYPYLDQSDCWSNATGSGIAQVAYTYSGMSARSNSNSNSNYSDYEGSGVNNLFFGSDSYFEVGNIALSSALNYTLSFGTEKYVYDAKDNTFDPKEFHAYVSNDGKKWVELTYAFPNGYKNGRWDLASSTFTIPSGTSALYVYIKSDLASAHRMDDLKLAVSETAGTAIDFSKGVEIGGGEGGGDDAPTDIKNISIKDFLALTDEKVNWYRLTGVISNIASASYGNFDLTDPKTGDKVYVYGLKSSFTAEAQSFAELGLAVTDTVTLVGQHTVYKETTIEVINGYYESHKKGPGVVSDGKYSSNVTWTPGESSYDETATVNGSENVKILKIGKSKGAGSATITIPKGSTSVSFYAYGWKDKETVLSIKMNGAEVKTIDVAANAGCTGIAPYTITAAEADLHTFDIGMTLPADVPITVTTKDGATNYRVVMFAINAK